MKPVDHEAIAQIRSFNRYYTNILGLLNKHILDSPYSLTEVRILLEIGKTDECTANALIEKLEVDRGYMSRIIKRFEGDGLIIKNSSPKDGRIAHLQLTMTGRQTLEVLEDKSVKQIDTLIAHLSAKEKNELLCAMKTIKHLLAPEASKTNIRSYRPGDEAYVIGRHRELYDSEYGFSPEFGDYVETAVLKFAKDHDKRYDNIWIAEHDGKPAGAIAIVKVDDNTAQLRWFLMEPELRGKGIGRLLMQNALEFCRSNGYKHVFLWTVSILEAARHLYEAYGFKRTQEVENRTWYKEAINEERWDLELYAE